MCRIILVNTIKKEVDRAFDYDNLKLRKVKKINMLSEEQ